MSHTPGHAGDPNSVFDLAVGAAVAGNVAGVSKTAADDPLMAEVWMGGGKTTTAPSRFEGKALPDAPNGLNVGSTVTTKSGDDVTNVGEAYDRFHKMTPKQRKAFGKQLEELGVLEPGQYGYGELASLWREATDEAADIYRASGRKVSPTGYLRLQRQSGMGRAVEEDTFDPRDVSSGTSTQVNLTTKAEARTAIRTGFQQELGRNPSRKETRAFFAALRAAQQRNPEQNTERRVTTRKRGGNDNSNTSSTTSGGVGSEFLENYVEDNFDAEQDQRASATTYYDALLGLAGGGN